MILSAILFTFLLSSTLSSSSLKAFNDTSNESKVSKDANSKDNADQLDFISIMIICVIWGCHAFVIRMFLDRFVIRMCLNRLLLFFRNLRLLRLQRQAQSSARLLPRQVPEQDMPMPRRVPEQNMPILTQHHILEANIRHDLRQLDHLRVSRDPIEYDQHGFIDEGELNRGRNKISVTQVQVYYRDRSYFLIMTDQFRNPNRETSIGSLMKESYTNFQRIISAMLNEPFQLPASYSNLENPLWFSFFPQSLAFSLISHPHLRMSNLPCTIVRQSNSDEEVLTRRREVLDDVAVDQFFTPQTISDLWRDGDTHKESVDYYVFDLNLDQILDLLPYEEEVLNRLQRLFDEAIVENPRTPIDLIPVRSFYLVAPFNLHFFRSLKRKANRTYITEF